MNNYPKFAKVGDRKYKINTDFRIALKCNEISEDENISDEERALAIIYLLFGDAGLNNSSDWNELMGIALKFLKCGKESNKNENNENQEANMSFEQDWGYIQASFFSDYNIDLSKMQMHWWQFYDLLCGLTDKSVLNRVRFVRDFDIRQIKDEKEKKKWIEQKKQVALKKERKKTEEERRLDELFEEQLKGGK